MLEQLGSSQPDLVGMQLELVGELEQRAIASDRGQCHLYLERGGTMATGSFHALCSSAKRPLEQSYPPIPGPILQRQF